MYNTEIDIKIQNSIEIDMCCICLEANTEKSIKMPCCKNCIHAECLFQILVSPLPIIKKCALCRTNINKEVFSIEQIMMILNSSDSAEHEKIYINTYLKSENSINIPSVSSVSLLNSIRHNVRNIRHNNIFQLIYLTIIMFSVIGVCLVIYIHL